MQIKTEKMPTPVKYIVTVDENEMEERKTKTYEQKKQNLELHGFRKGNVPRSVAEDRLGVDKLYKTLIDDIYYDVSLTEPIVSSRNFKFYGDLKKKMPLTIEFIADVKPSVNLVSFDKIKGNIEFESVCVSEIDLKNRIDFELKQLETIEDSTKDILDNLDVAIIDFEGKIEGQSIAFKGGTAKGFQIRVNEVINGKKQFVDNFEDQLVGMKLGETREIKVKFPSDYRDKNLSDKNVIFTVILKSIKTKCTPEYNLDFAKKKGFETIEEYEKHLKNNILETKQKKAIENFKKLILTEIINKSDISPIPDEMIEVENEKEWKTFLRRINKTEEQFIKENKNSKEYFFENNTAKSIEVIKAFLVIKNISDTYKIDVDHDEVVQYVMRMTNLLKYDKDREAKIREELENNKQQYELMVNAARNEKTIEFLFEQFKS